MSKRWLVWIRWMWPQVPLALVIIAAGAMNVLAGVKAQALVHILPGLEGTLPKLSQQVSLAALGSGAQVILGGGLVLTGFGMIWRVRVAWTFALLLLLITVAVNIGKGHFGTSLILPLIIVVALIALQGYFTHRTLLGSSLISLVSILAVLAYGTFGVFLLGDDFDPKIHSLITALYFTIETLSTVGYGDYHPATYLAQGYIITLIVFGLSVFATAIFSLLGPSLVNNLNRIFTPTGGRIVHKDHVILVGRGTLARNTARELQRRGIAFVQLVATGEDPPIADAPSVSGDVSEDAVLNKAGIDRARLLIAAEDDDGENAFISLAAKDLNPEIRVLAVASSRRSIRRLKLARADVVFAPTEVGSRLLANLVEGESLPPEFMDLLTSS